MLADHESLVVDAFIELEIASDWMHGKLSSMCKKK